MPFGFFDIDGEFHWGKKKGKKQKNKKVKAEAVVSEPVELKSAAQKSETATEFHEQKSRVELWKNPAATMVRILLIGETTELMRDYLCALKQNMDELLNGSELTYYTKENETISEIVEVKKELADCFWEGKDKTWPDYQETETDRSEKNYTFSISPAGNPQISVDLQFVCRTPAMVTEALRKDCRATWILADGSGDASAETGRRQIRQLLSSIQAEHQAQKEPVLLLAFNLEQIGHFKGIGANAQLSDSVRSQVYSNCRTAYKEACRGCNPRLYTIQLYGGLEQNGRDEKGRPMYKVNDSGYFNSYVPEGCHMPLLSTLTAARENEDPFLVSAAGERMWMALQKCFNPYLGLKQWRVSLLKEEDPS